MVVVSPWCAEEGFNWGFWSRRDRRLGGEIGAFKVEILGIFVSSFRHPFFGGLRASSLSSVRFMVIVYSLRT